MTTWIPRRSPYPQSRPRRQRRMPWSRELRAENTLSTSQLIYPVFVHDKKGSVAIDSMPGQSRLDIDGLKNIAEQAQGLGIPALAIFPVIDDTKKNEEGSEAWNDKNLVCQSISAIKSVTDNLGIICDVALDPFTSHGQDGIVKNGRILNDETNTALIKQSLNQAAAGCDVIAPSDMMDGRIGAIRKALDGDGSQDTLILSYAAKYASAFYGPFRDAVASKGKLAGADKKTYQMDPRNSDEALEEVALDLQEGADWVMVKPGMPYLDIVRRVKETFAVPVASYHVSGEYAMLKAAAAKGWLDEKECMLETMHAFVRAGSDMILTYAAIDVAKWLTKK